MLQEALTDDAQDASFKDLADQIMRQTAYAGIVHFIFIIPMLIFAWYGWMGLCIVLYGLQFGCSALVALRVWAILDTWIRQRCVDEACADEKINSCRKLFRSCSHYASCVGASCVGAQDSGLIKNQEWSRQSAKELIKVMNFDPAPAHWSDTRGGVPEWMWRYMFFMPHFLDPIGDAYQAGSAFVQVSATEDGLFKSSWEAVPLLNTLIGKLGLGGSLLVLLAVSRLFQIYHVYTSLKQARSVVQTGQTIDGDTNHEWNETEWDPAKGDITDPDAQDTPAAAHRRWRFWHEVIRATDCSGCFLISSYLSNVGQYDSLAMCDRLAELKLKNKLEKIPFNYEDRIMRFFFKVILQMLPTLWMHISLLSFTLWDEHDRIVLNFTSFMNLASIVLSWGMIAMSIPPVISKAIPMIWQRLKGWRCFRWMTEMVGGVAISVLTLTFCMLRLIGMFFCHRPHIWNVSEFGCFQP